MRGLVAGLLTFLIFFTLQAAVLASVKVSRRALVLVGLWILCLPVYLAVYALLPEDAVFWPEPLAAPSDPVTLLSGSLLYLFLFMGNAQFVYMAESSVGVRALMELSSDPEKGLSLRELIQRYPNDRMLERRLRRLIHAGYLVEHEGWYETTLRGRLVAAVFARCKSILRIGPGG